MGLAGENIFWEAEIALDNTLSLDEGRHCREASVFRMRRAWHRVRPRGRSGNPQAGLCRRADTKQESLAQKICRVWVSEEKSFSIVFLILSLVKKNPFQTLHVCVVTLQQSELCKCTVERNEKCLQLSVSWLNSLDIFLWYAEVRKGITAKIILLL